MNDSAPISLREYVDLRLAAHDTAHHKFEASLNERLVTMNRLRDQLADERARYVTNEQMDAFEREYRVAHEALKTQFASDLATLRSEHLSDLKELRAQFSAVAERATSVASRVTLLLAVSSVVGALLIFTLGLLIQHLTTP